MNGRATVGVLRTLALTVLLVGAWRLLGNPMIAKIVVSKSERWLRAYASDGTLVREFPAIVGRSGLGTKEVEGDERTPEGEYYVCFKNPRSRFHLSLGLSYPNLEDARRGLDRGLIDTAQYGEIADAHAARRSPPWRTPLGGEIFIHGEADGRGGTAGCVGVSNSAIEALFPWVELGTTVVIQP
jgi:murein L,D-transpeptidase YafK